MSPVTLPPAPPDPVAGGGQPSTAQAGVTQCFMAKNELQLGCCGSVFVGTLGCGGSVFAGTL